MSADHPKEAASHAKEEPKKPEEKHWYDFLVARAGVRNAIGAVMMAVGLPAAVHKFGQPEHNPIYESAQLEHDLRNGSNGTPSSATNSKPSYGRRAGHATGGAIERAKDIPRVVAKPAHTIAENSHTAEGFGWLGLGVAGAAMALIKKKKEDEHAEGGNH